MPAPKLGKFDSSTTRTAAGRLIDTWTYRCGMPGFNALEVKVSMVSPKDGEFNFVANCEAFKAPVSHSDLNILRRQIDEKLQDWCADRSTVVWVDWLEVIVNGRALNYQGQIGMEMSIKYRKLPRAVLPDGRVVTVNSMGRVDTFPEPQRTRVQLDPSEIQFDDRESGTEISYIPATPEAIASLEALQGRLDQLRVALSEVLSQACITDKLKQIAAGPLALPNLTSDAAVKESV